MLLHLKYCNDCDDADDAVERRGRMLGALYVAAAVDENEGTDVSDGGDDEEVRDRRMVNHTVTAVAAASEDRIAENPASDFDRFADQSFHRMHNNLVDRVRRVWCPKHVYLIECDACSKDCWQLVEHNLHSNWGTVNQFVDSGRTSCW